MTLKELIKAVDENNLTKPQLEEYRDKLANLAALMQLELADLEKAEALFFLENKQDTDVATKRAWKGSAKGQRMIELTHYYKAAEKILSSLKSRLYSIY